MPKSIVITAGNITLEAELNDSATAQAVAEALPIEAAANCWGDEIYFSIDVEASAEPDAGDVVEVGDLAFWPPGNAFCIFFGPTPVSRSGECRAASAVNVIGRVHGDPTALRGVRDGASVTIESA